MRPGCELFENVDVFYNEKTGELFVDDHESDEQLVELKVVEETPGQLDERIKKLEEAKSAYIMACPACHCKRREENMDDLIKIIMRASILAILAFVFVLGLFGTVAAIIDQATYGDWTCVFKHCVDVKGGE